MAFSAKQTSLFLLLTLLSSLHTHARESQFFNKVPSATTSAAVPLTNEAANPQQDPTFLPEKDDSLYGLYGHESGQNPPSTAEPSTTTPTAEPSTTIPTGANREFRHPVNKYLPKNYNPVAYVTQPDDTDDTSATKFTQDRRFGTNPTTFTEDRSFATNPTTYYNGGAQNQYNNQQDLAETEFKSYPNNNGGWQNQYNNQQDFAETEFKSYPKTFKGNSQYYYNGGSSFNTNPQGLGDSAFDATALRSRGNYYNNGNDGFRPQGMSDTRFMENGKYFYDINAEKYSNNHPYESLKGARENAECRKNFYGNSENNGYNEFNAVNYQNQEEFGNLP